MHIIHSTENLLHESNDEECPANKGYITATPSSGVLPFTTSDSITINISGNVPTTQRDFVYISWYLNGSSLASGTSRSSLLKLPTGITQTLRINNPTPLHNGTYDAVLRLNDWSYFREFGCPNYYSAGLRPNTLDQITIDLRYYGELILVSFSPAAVYDKCNWPIQNQLQFSSSQADQLFGTMSPPLSIAQLMVATLLSRVFHGSRMAESSPHLIVMKSL